MTTTISPLALSHAQIWSLCVASYSIWRLYVTLETKRIKLLAEAFVRDGYVAISGVSPKRKRVLWDTILSPVLQKYWASRHSTFDITSVDSWPTPIGGKAYGDTFTDESIPGLPALISENYEAQAILVYFCSGSSFRCISFGSQTHWRLKLLISPFWAVGLWKGPSLENSSYLVGKDQSWHLVNWPAGSSEGNVVGNQFHNGAHIDSGENWFYGAHGFPPMCKNHFNVEGVESSQDRSNDAPKQCIPLELDSLSTPRRNLASAIPRLHGIEPSDSVVDAVMASLLIPQLAILFYCETPGDVSAMQGMTGFYRDSHYIFCAALQQFLSIINPYGEDYCGYQNLTLQACIKALKKWGGLSSSLGALVQPTLADGQAILCFGTMAHTSMRAQEPLRSAIEASQDSGRQHLPSPRVLQNLKVYFSTDKKERLSFSDYLNSFHPDSLASKFLCNPWQLYHSLNRQASPICNDQLSSFDIQNRTSELTSIFLEAHQSYESTTL